MIKGISRSSSMVLLSAALLLAALPAASAWADQAETLPWIKMGNYATTENLNAVTASSKKSVWFAGDNGTILKWDGTKFTAYKVELPDGVRLRDIHMFSATDGWAVGYNTANYYGRIYHWDSRAWKLATSEGIKGFKCCAIAFLNKQDGLIAGEEGRLYRWDGRTWVDASSAIYGIGRAVNQGNVGLVTDLVADQEKGVYILACSYKTHNDPPRTDGVYIRLDLKSNPPGMFYNSPVLDGVVSYQGNRIFSVPGGKSHCLAYKTVYAFSPSVTTYQKAGIRQYSFTINQGGLRSLWMFGKNDGWFVGEYGIVASLLPGPASKSYWPVSERLNDIWMLDKDFGFIAGDKGTVLMRNTTAGVALDLNLDKLEYDSGEQVIAGINRLSQAAPVTMPLTGALWEIKKETTTDERTTLTTVYSLSLTPPRDDNQSLDPGEVLTLKWNQKNSQGRQVEPGVYRVVFRLGDQAPGFRFTIRAPSGPFTSTDLAEGQGVLSLDLQPSYLDLVNITFKLVNHNARSVSLSGETYSVSIMREDGWHGFYESGTRSAFNPGTMAAGQTYEWVWNNSDTSGRQRAQPGHYKLTVNLPGQTPSQLSKEFEIRAR